MRFNDLGLSCFGIDIYECDMGEISGVIISTRDQRRGGCSAPRNENIAAVYLCPPDIGRRCLRRLIPPLNHDRVCLLRDLQHNLFDRGAAAIEEPVKGYP